MIWTSRLTSIVGSETQSAHRFKVFEHEFVVMDDGDSSGIIDSYDKIMTKVNVCINGHQQQIYIFGQDNINYYGTKQ